MAESPIPVGILKGHTDPVYAVAVSGDRKRIATASLDKSIRVWDSKGKLELTFSGDTGHQNQVLTVAFSPDNLRLATGSADNTVRVWSLAKLAPAELTLTHPNLVDALAWDKAGTRIATGCHDGNLRIWDIAKPPGTAKVIAAHTLPAPNPIYGIAWLPDGKVITASYDQTIKIWDVTDAGKVITTIFPWKAAVTVNDKFKASAATVIGAVGIGLLNAPPSFGHRDQIYAVAVAPDGKSFASAGSDRRVVLWDTATGERLREFQNPNLKPIIEGEETPAHPSFVHGLKFTSDGSRLVSVGSAIRNKGYVAVWNVKDGKMVAGYELDHGPVYAVDILSENTAVLGCGPKARGQTDSDAIILPLPLK